jgi:hypothetical protein
MLPARYLRFELAGGFVEPEYLDGRHASLVRSLLGLYRAFEGEPRQRLDAALAAAPELRNHDVRLVRGLAQVLDESIRLAVRSPVDPRRIRETVFRLARRELDLTPEEAYARAASELGVEGTSDLHAHLYADLRPERRVRFTAELPSPGEAISRYNFRLLQGLLLQAVRLRVDVFEAARAVYRLARLHGLLLEVRAPPASSDAPLRLDVTGPLSLFQRTRKYGLALARFLPACAAGGRYRIEALLFLRGGCHRLVVTEADRLLSPHVPPREFDSKLEERFRTDFIRLGSRWDLYREAQLIPLGSTVFLPDFTFRLRAPPHLVVDLEIVGFWTRDYLARKRTLLAQAERGSERRIIVCVDRRFCCDRGSPAVPFLSFSGRVPAARVLEALEAIARSPPRFPDSSTFGPGGVL